MKHFGARLAVAVVAGAVLAAPQLPALATPATTPTITIAAKSTFQKVTGDVFVVYRAGSASSATISGSIASATAGEIVKVYAKQFPFSTAAAPVGTPITLSTTGTDPYSFSVTPTLATRYKVELFASDGTTLLAVSPRVTVFVAVHSILSGGGRCARPTCSQTYHYRTVLPALAFRIERSKRWYSYFGVRLNATHIPPAPRTIRLGAGHVRVSATRKLNGHEYAVTFTFRFFIGRNAAHWAFNFCQKDTEAKDGLGLPGHHGCGLTFISSHRYYLG
jgi:hypothetical protein